MRTRTLAMIALLSLPCALSAQRIRLPRSGRGAKPGVAQLPPEMPAVAKALAYKRSRWSAEAYSLVNSVAIPGVAGGAANYKIFGTGTRSDYRFTDRFAATMDLTVSAIGAPATVGTVEVGTRYSPFRSDRKFRPFFDVRTAYTHISDSYTSSLETSIATGGTDQPFLGGGRSSHGYGGLAGAGFEYSLTTKFALTTELSALRNRMTTVSMAGSPSGLGGSTYWMNTYRYTLGVKYMPGHSTNLKQKTTP